MPRRCGGRGSQKYAQALFVVFVVLLFYQAISKSDTISTTGRSSTTSHPPNEPESLLHQQARFWRALYSHVLNNDPQCTPPETLGIPHKLDTMYDPDHDVPRPDILWLKPQDVQKLKSAHARFLEDIRDKPPSIPYEPGTRGIAVTASFQLLPVLAISLRMLRRTGCILPVEVFLADPSDYDAQVCEHIFPSLNAKCLIFQSIVSAAGTGVALTRFQYKIMAILFASFETVLLLDSDAFPINNPTYLFTSPPLTNHGLILWPDFWYPSESPYFFQIASIHPIPPLNARPATESGEILVHKPNHTATLLLAAYYNYYGPDLYYALQSQGAPGQGDKETFGWAAVATSSPFYVVHTPVIALGHLDSNGAFFGSAMAQHDPVADYALHRLPSSSSSSSSSSSLSPAAQPQPHLDPNPNPNLDPHNAADNIDDDDKHFPAPQTAPTAASSAASTASPPPRAFPLPLFIHANHPKPDPSRLFLSTTQPLGSIGAVFDSNGTSVRPWGPAVFRTPAGAGAGANEDDEVDDDLEKAFWTEIAHVACEWQEIFGAWEKVRGEGLDVCLVVRRWMGKVFGEVQEKVVLEQVEGGSAVKEEEMMVEGKDEGH